MKTRALVLVGVLLLVLGMATGCGGTKKSSKTAPQRLATAQKYLDQTDGVKIALSTPQLPQGVQGIVKATGIGTKQPAFKGDITVVQNGLSVNVPVRAVEGKVYIQFGGIWQSIDPAKFGAPDPADLFKNDGGLATILTDVKHPATGQDTRKGKRVLSTITGKIPGSRVASIIPSASAKSDFAATFTLDDTDHLASVVLKGPFYPKSDDVTYTIGFSDYGSSTIVTAP
jgi:lipoprotein LprG